MSLIKYVTSSDAGITASNISLFVLFVLAFSVIYSLIFKRIDKKRNIKENLLSFVNDNLLRTPFGFIIVLLGLMFLFAFNIPKYSLDDINMELWKKIYDPDNGIITWVHFVSEILIYVGFSIIFWPTILILAYRLFGDYNFEEVTYIWIAIFMIILFKLSLTLFGVMVHYRLLSYF